MPPSPLYDVLILGAGPAGLSCAQALCRQAYTTLLFTTGTYRNDSASHMHNFPTWDHKPPSEFRAAAIRNMEPYGTVRVEERRVKSVKKVDDAEAGGEKGLFEAKDAKGDVWRGRAVVLAMGVRDVFPDIKGYDKVWGKAIFHCLFCHGYEERGGASCGVMASGMMSTPHIALQGARMTRNLAKAVTIYTNGDTETTPKMLEFFGPRGIAVETRKIVAAAYYPDSVDCRLTLTFEDGERKGEAFLLDHPTTEVNGPFVEQLVLEMGDGGVIKTNAPFYETSVKGVFAIGDCATPMKAVVQAVAMGGFAAVGIASRLGALVPGLED